MGHVEADFVAQLFSGRLVDEQLMSTMLNSHHWQVRIYDISYEERVDIYGGWNAEAYQETEAGEITRSLHRDAITRLTWIMPHLQTSR
ncbi:hypothetical protein Bca52824_006943 [Brassica carinata]|uniref:Uncharacterized protein n=1 Tax=Brassica carinata TaxID=52824 RepID=A0A8X7W866_BRACI|nr:hypothetical protein Bca52824_006943 [Brassica carinata]